MEGLRNNRKKTKVVGSKGVCFFCLSFKDSDNGCGGEEINCSSFFRTSSLRHIARFIHLNAEKSLNLGNSSNRSKIGVDDDIIVNCCQVCSSLTEEFKELFILFEETKLYLMACITRIREAMKMDDFQEDLVTQKGLLSGEDFKLMSTLRKEVVQKFDLKLKSSTPYVTIERLTDNQLSSTTAPVFVQVKQESGILLEEGETEHDFLNVKNEVQNPEPEVELMEVDDNDSWNPDIPDSPKSTDACNRSSLSVKDTPCPHCETRFSEEYDHLNLNRHLALKHEEHLFPNIKRKDLTTDQFKLVVNDTLNLFTKEGDCSLCEKKYNTKYKSQKTRYVRTHLLQNHYSTLAKKIIQVQKNPDLLKQIVGFGDFMIAPESEYLVKFEAGHEPEEMMDFVDGSESPEIQCPNNEEWLRNFFVREKSASTRAADFISKSKLELKILLCPHCPKIFDTNERLGKKRYRLRQHIANYHEEHLFPNIKRENLSNSQFKFLINYVISLFIKDGKCHCGQTYCSRDKAEALYSKGHVVKKHHEAMVEKLVEIQDDPVLLKSILNDKCGEGESEEFYTFNKKETLSYFFNRKKITKSETGSSSPRIDTETRRIINLTKELETNKKYRNEREETNNKKEGQFEEDESEAIQCLKNEKTLKNFLSRKKSTEINTSLGSIKSRQNLDVRCPHCLMAFSTNQHQQVNKKRHLLRLHIANIHEELFFPNIKKEDLTESQFKNLVNYEVNLYIKDGKCKCGQSYSAKDTTRMPLYLKNHVVKQHNQDLVERLIAIQNDPVMLKEILKN